MKKLLSAAGVAAVCVAGAPATASAVTVQHRCPDGIAPSYTPCRFADRVANSYIIEIGNGSCKYDQTCGYKVRGLGAAAEHLDHGQVFCGTYQGGATCDWGLDDDNWVRFAVAIKN
jgi:hypothetical protein